jgi:large subunit ribosomal protein L21
MYAVVNIAGQQYRVTEAQKLYVPLLESEVGTTVEFPQVLLLSDDSGTKLGTPVLGGALVKATVLAHVKDEKVLVFKKKRRKGFKRLRGHRQQFTQVEINSIEAQ